ncbi:acyltransferase family protein [Winogradskyella helgolandensis]|uniref:acyltransferase family protein n=1 Tax=Winogradskyella helgolandensis TaxID=2697010 RepID=UPI0015B9FD20|nr:acyltransferase [Winogradskyella helgolandensis]
MKKIEVKPKEYFKSLDGLRFIAAIAVLLFHKINNTDWLYYESSPILYRAFSFIFRNGFIGVNFFFVLSGFLITYLIQSEIFYNGSFNFKGFIARRVLRIWPLFFLIVIIGFSIKDNTDGIFYYISFLSNIEVIYNHGNQSGILFPLWSVSIEEQYYFLIPLIFIIFKIDNKNKFMFVYVGLLLVSIFYQFIYNNNINKLHYSTMSCITDLSIGGMTATLVFYSKSFVNYFKNLKGFSIVVIYILGISYIFIRVYIDHILIFRVFERCVLALFFAFIILEQTYSTNSLFKISKFNFLNRSAKYTYAIYMFHMIFIIYIHHYWKAYAIYDNIIIDIFIKTILVIILTYFLSILSYRYIESPFLRLKNKFNWKK